MQRADSLQYLKASTKWKAHLAEMILREIVQDAAVNLILAEYRLVLFEAKAPQPPTDVHGLIVALIRPPVIRSLASPAA